MVHRKQITMRYSEDVGDCCRSLVETAHVPSDIRLIHFIQLQRLAEEITSTFGYDDVSHRLPHSRIEGTELLVTAFKSRLRELRTSFPTNGICHCEFSLPTKPGCESWLQGANYCSASINLAYDSVCVYLYEVSLHDRRPAPKQSRDFSYQLQQPYHARTNLLVGCLEATKTFLDDYLQISSHTLEFHTILEKGQRKLYFWRRCSLIWLEI